MLGTNYTNEPLLSDFKSLILMAAMDLTSNQLEKLYKEVIEFSHSLSTKLERNFLSLEDLNNLLYQNHSYREKVRNYHKTLKKPKTSPGLKKHACDLTLMIAQLISNHCLIFRKVYLSSPFWVNPNDLRKIFSKSELEVFLLLDELKAILFNLIAKAHKVKSQEELDDVYQKRLDFKIKSFKAVLLIQRSKRSFSGSQQTLRIVVSYQIV